MKAKKHRRKTIHAQKEDLVEKAKSKDTITNLDWFHFENRIRKLNYEILEPITSKQRKQDKMMVDLL